MKVQNDRPTVPICIPVLLGCCGAPSQLYFEHIIALQLVRGAELRLREGFEGVCSGVSYLARRNSYLARQNLNLPEKDEEQGQTWDPAFKSL